MDGIQSYALRKYFVNQITKEKKNDFEPKTGVKRKWEKMFK